MGTVGRRTFDVVLVLAVIALPVLAVVEALDGHPWFLVLMVVSLALQRWRAKYGSRCLPASARRPIPGHHRTSSSVEGEPQ